MEINDELKQNGNKLINDLKNTLNTIRTNRISSSLVENIIVETYNNTTKLRLLELSTITNEDPQTLLLTPFDPSTIADIEKAILKSPLGITPQIQGSKIILKFPPLNQEQREKLIKLINQITEEKRQELRNLRDNARKKVKLLFENKQITEDQKYSIEKKIDEETKKINDTLLEIKAKKEKEINEF